MTLRLVAAGSALAIALAACSQSYAPPPVLGTGAPAQGLVRSNFSPPAKLNFFQVPEQGSWPEFIVAGPQRKLWFSDLYSATIASIATDGTITEFPINGQEVEGIAAGADGNLWFTEPGADQVGKMTPSGKATLFQINGSNPSPRGITQGPDPPGQHELVPGFLESLCTRGAGKDGTSWRANLAIA